MLSGSIKISHTTVWTRRAGMHWINPPTILLQAAHHLGMQQRHQSVRSVEQYDHTHTHTHTHTRTHTHTQSWNSSTRVQSQTAQSNAHQTESRQCCPNNLPSKHAARPPVNRAHWAGPRYLSLPLLEGSRRAAQRPCAHEQASFCVCVYACVCVCIAGFHF